MATSLIYKQRKMNFKLNTNTLANGRTVYKNFSLAGLRATVSASSIANVVLTLGGLLEFDIAETTVVTTEFLVI
jgi:hypothetical protein